MRQRSPELRRNRVIWGLRNDCSCRRRISESILTRISGNPPTPRRPPAAPHRPRTPAPRMETWEEWEGENGEAKKERETKRNYAVKS